MPNTRPGGFFQHPTLEGRFVDADNKLIPEAEAEEYVAEVKKREDAARAASRQKLAEGAPAPVPVVLDTSNLWAELLAARGEATINRPAAEPSPAPPPPAAKGTDPAPAPPAANSDELPEDFPGRVALADNKLTTVSAVAAKTDEQLLALPHVGERTVPKIAAHPLIVAARQAATAATAQ